MFSAEMARQLVAEMVAAYKPQRAPPPLDYVCAACSVRGHWIEDCARVRALQKTTV
jgi:hypothetical protein